MANLPMNLASEKPAIAPGDRVFIWDEDGFSTQAGPAADAAARANPPQWKEWRDIRTWAGAFVASGETGRFYTHGGKTYLCVADTNDAPSSTNANWLVLSDDVHYQGAWASGTQYKVGNVVLSDNEFYRCLRDHTSGDDLEQDVDQDRWLRDSFPDYMTAADDALGINIAPDAVIHALSYDGHTHGSNLAKLERFGDGDVYLSFQTNGQERGRISFVHGADYMAVDAVNEFSIRINNNGLFYNREITFSDQTIAPNVNNGYDIGAVNLYFRRIYANQITSVRTFDTAAARDAALPNPLDGQLSRTNEQLQIYIGGAWVNATPPEIDSFLDLDDTPAVMGQAGSRVVVNRTATGLAFEAGAIPPEVREGWGREAGRDFSPGAIDDATNFLQVEPDDPNDPTYDGVGLAVGERYIAAPQGVVIPPYGGEQSPDIRVYNFDPTAAVSAVAGTRVDVAPRYHHGNSQGALAEYQRAGFAAVEWGGLDYRIHAYYDPHTRRPYFAFSTTSLFNSPTFGAEVAGDVMFNLGEHQDELFAIAVPSPDDSHLQDFELYALVLNKIVRIRFNNDPEASSLLTSDHDTVPQVTTVAEFTRHQDAEDLAARKYYVGDLFDGNRSRGLTWKDNVLLWATNLGIFAIDSYTGERITELDTTWNDVGGYPAGLDNQSMDAAGLAWYGDYVYLLYHQHHAGAAATDSHIRAYHWRGDPIGRFARQPALSTSGALPTATQSGLPNWVQFVDEEQAIQVPVGRYGVVKHSGADRTAEQQFATRQSGAVDLTIGSALHTVKFEGRVLGDYLPAGVGLFDIGDGGSSAVRTTYTENLRAHNISARVPFSLSDPDDTGLVIEGVTRATGNFQSIRVFATVADRTLALPQPFPGVTTYIEDSQLVELWTGSQWVDIGGEHAGGHADLSQVATDIIPFSQLTYDLGSRDRRWAEVHGDHLYARYIETEDDGGQGILNIGSTDRGLVNPRGRWDFANTTVVSLPSGITHTLSYTSGNITVRLIDDSGNWNSTTSVTPTQLAQSLARIDADDLPDAGLVLRIAGSGNVEWGAPYGPADAIHAGRYVATTGGTTALVAYGFDGDDHTGIYSPAVNNVGIVCGGEERWRVTHHGDWLPNPQDDDEQPYRVGATSAHQRVDLFARNVNYDALLQDSARAKKFGIDDPDRADWSGIYDIRIRGFQYRDFPADRRLGVVAEEVTGSLARLIVNDGDGNAQVDTTYALYAAIYAIQELRAQIQYLSQQTGHRNLPSRAAWPATTANERGVPPAGWNADGTRQNA